MPFLQLKRFLPYLMVVLFGLALWSLYHQLHAHHWRTLVDAIRNMPARQVWLALLLTAASYMVMTGYDYLALRYVRHPLPYGKAALASGLGYAFSNNVGFSMLAGASIRYRVYSNWGLSAVEITQVVLFCTLSIWLGFLGLSGIVFLLAPPAVPQELHLPGHLIRLIGALLLAVVGVYGLMTEYFYNFKGLRQYKEKFDPQWRPKYLACPGGLALPRMLADVGSLVSGGVSGVLFK